MNVELSKRQIASLLSAIRHAIDEETAFIDAHRATLGPGEFLRGSGKAVRHARARIARWRALYPIIARRAGGEGE